MSILTSNIKTTEWVFRTLRVPSFNASPELTYSELNKARHADLLILDLREDIGGWEDSLTALSSFFINQPDLLAKKISRTQSQDWIIKPRDSGFHGSIIVLVDSASASASELAARYLQATHKAVVIGDVTSGRVNQGQLFMEKIGARFVMPFASYVTTAKVVMADGDVLEGRGVIPDVQCVPTPDELIRGVDPCLEKAIALAKKSLPQNDVR
jgi:carboxyl-terminal processing protease